MRKWHAEGCSLCCPRLKCNQPPPEHLQGAPHLGGVGGKGDPFSSQQPNLLCWLGQGPAFHSLEPRPCLLPVADPSACNYKTYLQGTAQQLAHLVQGPGTRDQRLVTVH